MSAAHEDNLLAYREQLMDILEHASITSVFQPIVSLRDGAVLGYEALSRGPAGTDMESPAMLFAVAEASKALWELERLCRTKALSAMQCAKSDTTLFLNVNPCVMEDAKFQKGFTREYLREFDIDPRRIIFEITERSAVRDIGEFKEIIHYYKDQQYQIAIDDAGAGYSGLNLISDIHPHYLKLDMQLIHNIDKDTVKQALVKSMQEFAKITGTYLIAEGIETLSELETLIHIGVQYGQGYFIKRPSAALSPLDQEIVDTIADINAKKNRLYGYNLAEVFIGNLCIHAPSVNEQVMIQEAYAMLLKKPELQGFCVTRDGYVQGVVTRNRVNTVVAGVYGYSLYSRKTISSIMDREFLSLDYKTPVTVSGKLAMARPEENVYDFITVTLEGKYYGIVTIKDLLNKTIEVEVSNATQLNPLTALPGNILIEKALSAMLLERENRCVLYFDIDNFKAYNDVYGFENGDRVIRHLALCIKSHMPEDAFTGHVGGDDFVSIVRAERAEEICRTLIADFDRSIRAFYKPEDAQNGYIITKNRQGMVEQFPMISLSIAGLRVCERRFCDVYSLTAESSRIKKECKQIPGSSYLIL
ncbi:MAG TPA: bifunctional diguanylate cyclase/phosphodiesterase [Feifaniaceae bacterium]|nr:bifunctional diguanylate cyclase/phosphodiesterase [Feifaniaceae bacterium]